MAEKAGRLALHDCVKSGDLDKVKKLLDKKWPVNRRDTDGCTSLHIAAEVGHTEIVKTLISYGAKINEKGRLERTPLHFCARGNEEIVKLLVQHGADIDAVDKDGNTPLQLAEKKKDAYDYSPEVEYFLRHARPVVAAQRKYLPYNQVKCSTTVKPKAKNTGTNTERKLTLNDCVKRGDLDKLTELLNDECPDDDKDADGWTPLCTSAWLGHTEIVEVLTLSLRNARMRAFE